MCVCVSIQFLGTVLQACRSTIRTVMSSEPLTKLRPSGISARQRTGPVWCVKVRTTVVLEVDEKLKSLMVHT